MTAFKTRDTVRLKAGGPVMTIHTVIAHEARCGWFDEHGTWREHYYALDLLEHTAERAYSPPGYATRQMTPPGGP
jgi:uncharacterized protein YodC (DUF2158 family)